MTDPALIYLVCGVMITASAIGLSYASYRHAFNAGHFSAGEPSFFEDREFEASLTSILFAFASGIFFALAGALLHASMMAA